MSESLPSAESDATFNAGVRRMFDQPVSAESGLWVDKVTLHHIASSANVTQGVAARVIAAVSTMKPNALRVAADELERAARDGEEIEVAWWWLRDRADHLEHRTTDPLCAHHEPPQTQRDRRRFDRGRGKACPVCTRVTTPAACEWRSHSYPAIRDALESLDDLCTAEDRHGDTIRAHEVRGAVADLRRVLPPTATQGGTS